MKHIWKILLLCGPVLSNSEKWWQKKVNHILHTRWLPFSDTDIKKTQFRKTRGTGTSEAHPYNSSSDWNSGERMHEVIYYFTTLFASAVIFQALFMWFWAKKELRQWKEKKKKGKENETENVLPPFAFSQFCCDTK